MENKLTLIGDDGKRDSAGRILYRYKCACGNTIHVCKFAVNSGHTRSCGCLKIKKLINRGSVVSTKKKLGNNTSGFTGVYWDTKNNKWRSQINYKSKRYRLGSYSSIEEAVDARNKFIKKNKIEKEYKIQ